MDLQMALGRTLSALFAPFTYLTSLVRGERIFHPDGVVYRAEVRRLAREGELGELAQRMSGAAMVRLSGGLWPWPQSDRRPDVLGISARFLADAKEMTYKSQPGDQDLLFVTARTLPGLIIAPFRTKVDDFLDNDYYAILPFTLENVGQVYLRMVPELRSPGAGDRRERLARAVENGTAVFRLEVQLGNRRGPWTPLVSIRLVERLNINDDMLEFDPSTTGMGLMPYGLLQWSRPGIYEGSQAGRRAGAKRRRNK